MSRHKKTGIVRHLHIDPYIWIGEDARKDAVLKWYESLPDGKRTAITIDLLAAAVLGEFGTQVQAAVNNGDTDAAIHALQDLMSAFGE